jgi:small subunit ribosomal protein S16
MRLRRTGKKKQAHYRVVVAESTCPRDGRFVEVVGHYDPGQNPPRVEFDEDKVLSWLKKGARPTDTVRSLLSRKGLMARLADEQPGHILVKKPLKGARKKSPAASRPEAPIETVVPAAAPIETVVPAAAEAETVVPAEAEAEAEA